MKGSFIILLLISVLNVSFGQEAMTFDEAKGRGIRTTYLDSLYQSGIHTEKKLAVFKHQQKKYIEAYQNLLQQLGTYLKENNFIWSKPTHGFNRIYFDKGGRIDYFLYSFRPDQILPEQEKIFGSLLQNFIQTYIFPLSAEKNFAQCSPVTYMPAEQ